MHFRSRQRPTLGQSHELSAMLRQGDAAPLCAGPPHTRQADVERRLSSAAPTRRTAPDALKDSIESAANGVRTSVPEWRRGWDSNPRYGCPYSGFRDRPIRPLWHPFGNPQFPPRGFAGPHILIVGRRARNGKGPPVARRPFHSLGVLIRWRLTSRCPAIVRG